MLQNNKNKVAVVILNFNGVDLFKEFLPSVIANTPTHYDLYIIDNASTDHSIEYLQQNAPQIKIIKNAKNEGFAKGYNLGLQQIDAEYYVLINSDIELTENCLQKTISFLDQNPNVAAVQPKILSYKNKNKFEYAGASGGFLDALFYPICRGRVMTSVEDDNNQYDDMQEIFWASGAAISLRAEAFKKVGGFDNFFFAHQEEIDLCWRMKRAGYQIFCLPQSVVYHLGGGTLAYKNLQKMYLNHRNNLIMIAKNLPLFKSIPIIIIRVFIEQIAEGTKELLKGNAAFYLKLCAAHIDFFKWLFTKYKASKNQKLPYLSLRKTSGVLYFKSIFTYYILNRKKFTQFI